MKKHLSLENLIYATTFLLPVYLVKVKVLNLPANILEILISIVVIWFILKRSFREFPACRPASPNRGEQAGLKPDLRMAIGLMFFGLLASILANKNYAVSSGIVKGWFVLPFLFALVVKNVISAEKRENIYKMLYLSAVFVAILSLAYYFIGVVTFDGRLQGIFNSPNYLAMYLAPAIIIGALNIKNSIFPIVSIGIILISFYLTYSYAAWLAVAITLIILWLIKENEKIDLRKSILVAGLLLVVIVSQWNTQKFADFKNFSERSSVRSRIMIWQATGKIIKDNWFWGVGPGNFQNKYLEYQKYFPLYLEWAVPHSHNLFLSFWLQTGLMGIIGFIGLLIIWFKNIFYPVKYPASGGILLGEEKEKDIIWFMSLGIMLYFILHGLTDTTYFKNDLAVIFWLNFFLVL